MEYEFETVYTDFSEHLRTGIQPAIVFSRDPYLTERRATAREQGFVSARVAPQGKWWVPVTPLNSISKIEWTFYNSEESLVAPVHAYKTKNKSPATILPVAFQLGLFAMDSFRRHTQDEVEKVMLFVGNNVYEKGESIQCLLGIAVRIRR